MCRDGRRKFKFTCRKNRSGRSMDSNSRIRLHVSIPLQGISLPEQPSLDDMISLSQYLPTLLLEAEWSLFPETSEISWSYREVGGAHTILFGFSSLLVCFWFRMDGTDHTQSPDSLVLCKFGKAANPDVMVSLAVPPTSHGN